MRTSDYYYGRAIFAALIATIVVACIILIKTFLNYLPYYNPAHLMGATMGGDAFIGWPVHFIGGTIIGGGLFAWLSPHLPGKLVVRGLIFGVLTWLVIMLAGMPMAGYGFFGANYVPPLSQTAADAVNAGVDHQWLLPLVMLALQLVYGYILGFTYSHLILQHSMGAGKRDEDTLANANPARHPAINQNA